MVIIESFILKKKTYIHAIDLDSNVSTSPSVAGYPRRSTVRVGRTVLPAFHDLVIIFRLLGVQILQLLPSCRCEAAVNH